MLAIKNFNKIKSVLNEDESNEFKKIFLKNTPIFSNLGDKCYGIDINNISYPWFKKKFFPKITKFFNIELKLIFAFYASFTKPFHIHNDLKPIPNNKIGTPFLSCLIPISVDNNKDLCHLASTIIFKNGKNIKAEFDHKNYLTHCELNTLKDKKIDKIFTWSPGDIIWWKSELDHCSSHFIKFKSKECFVIHTYVE